MNRPRAGGIGIPPGQRVPDAGCGVGGGAIWLAEPDGVKVVGITPVAARVARARSYARRRGITDRVSLEEQDSTHLHESQGR